MGPVGVQNVFPSGANPNPPLGALNAGGFSGAPPSQAPAGAQKAAPLLTSAPAVLPAALAPASPTAPGVPSASIKPASVPQGQVVVKGRTPVKAPPKPVGKVVSK